MKNKKFSTALLGVAIGFINGLLGAGGGMLTVPVLKKMGFEQNESHKNAVAVILPITVISATLYVLSGRVEVASALPFVPTGLIGAVVGTKVMEKISPVVLKKVFALFMIWAGVRLFF